MVLYDTYYFSGVKIIEMYDTHVITKRLSGRTARHKIYEHDLGKYIIVDGTRMYLKYFKESEEN